SVASRTTAGMRSNPACRAARNRRSPAMSCQPPARPRRTTMGWMTPDVLIDSASSSRAPESNAFRGCLGFGSLWAIGISGGVSPPAGASPRSASRPRPRPRLFMPQNLLGELEIRDGAARSHIVQHDRTAMAGRLAQADVAWDDSLEDVPWKVPMHFV